MANTFGIQSADPLGIASATSALVGLPQVTSANTDCADNGIGEYVPASQISFGETKNINCSYLAQTSGAVTPATITVGAAQAVATTSITITTTKGQRATGSGTGHEHIGGTGSVHNATSRKITTPAFDGFGASQFGLTGLGPSAAEMQSGTYTIEIGHTDDDDKDGNFLCGTCHGEKHTATFEAVSDTPFAVPSGWVNAGKGPTEGSKAHERQSITISKFIAYTPIVGP